MIRIPSAELHENIKLALEAYQAEVDSQPDFVSRVEFAAARFQQCNRPSNPTFRAIRKSLSDMCSGARRCMYCEDSVADEIEHHRPKSLFPEMAFVWDNYLYACGPCNSPKSNTFAVILSDGSVIESTRRRNAPVLAPPTGSSVLLHPRSENPLDFLMLDIAGGTFLFVPIADQDSLEFRRASYTISILQLNARDYLPVARKEAFQSYRARLREYAEDLEAGAERLALEKKQAAIKRMHHPTVWSEMCRQRILLPDLNSLFERVPEALNW